MVETKRYSGEIIKNNGKYYFCSKRGKVFNIAQKPELKELYENKNLIVLESVSQLDEYAYGNIVEVINGTAGELKSEIEAIARTYNLIQPIGSDVWKEVEDLPHEVLPEQIEGISDLRDIPFITIDPDKAKDYDDAVWAKKNDDGTYTLKVAIANVAAYLDPDSALYKHAMKLGTSAYPGNECYPMFPKKPSNGIWSINPNEDRLAMVTTCNVNERGELLDYMIEPAVIHSRHRLTYKEADFLGFGENVAWDEDDHSDLIGEVDDVMDSLRNLYLVAGVLYKCRMKWGALDIPSRAITFKIDEEGKTVTGYEKDHAEEYTSVIAETAILHNEIWGEVAEKLGVPFYYRNHKSIDSEHVQKLRRMFEDYNIRVPNPLTSKGMQEIVNKVTGKRIEEYVISSLLKASEAAYYDIHNIGHSGLAIMPKLNKSHKQAEEQYRSLSDCIADRVAAKERYKAKTGREYGLAFDGDITHTAYAQSSSPIRRGSDLNNQMQLLSVIMTGRSLFNYHDLSKHVDHLNMTERNADMASSECDDMLAVKWASDNIGKVFPTTTVVHIGENDVRVMAPDGFRMNLRYGDCGIKRKYLKPGSCIENVKIDSVNHTPPRVYGVKCPEKMICKDEDYVK
ncbi:MAG: RNB domain-containing ribonuclease [Clostridiales bacterium]|nr:RNB domain-containing ribonuclease [Clostridiales bacterium]